MKAYVAVTDYDWFRFLRERPELDEVNFWQPSGRNRFRALGPGEPVLFKLHAPRDFIVGGGFLAPGIVIAAALLAGGLAAPSPAVEPLWWTTGWSLGAEITQPHPKRLELVMPVTEERRIDNCDLSYHHWRRGGEGAAPEMGSGGKISVALEFVKGGETLKVGTGSVGVQVPEYSAYLRLAGMYFTDPSGYPEPGPVMTTPHLPIDLEAGDLIVWRVRFKGAKTLEFSDLGDGFWDLVDLGVTCYPCGSNAHPCD